MGCFARPRRVTARRVLPLLLLAPCLAASPPPPPPLDLLRARLVAAMLPDPSDALAPAVATALRAEAPWLVQTQRPDGSWPDIDYTDSQDASAWNASIALQRALILGVVSRGAGGGGGGAGLCNASVLATRLWLSRAPRNENWWWQQLGEVSCVARALLLCPDAAAAAAAAARSGLW